MTPGKMSHDPQPKDDMTLTQQDLEARLWGAANALRGPVDPADFKTYVFPMLFWKWICDTWQHEHAEALAIYDEALTEEIEADYHRFVVPPDCLWCDVVTRTDNLGVRIARALGKIEQANPNTLAGVFGDAAWGNKERLPESALVDLLDGFNGIQLDPDSVSHDALGHAYEYLLKEFAEASGKKAGEFFTPPAVVHLLVGILNPQPGETVYDPACGSGGMLVETVNSIRAGGADHREVRLFGQEVNLTTSAIARMNLSFHRAVQSEVRRGDTLREPKFRSPNGGLATFGVVIANPPFSLTNWGADTWAADARSFCGVPPAKNGDFAWIQHMISSMDDKTGRVGVVMPHGVLFRGGVEARIRQCLVEQDRLEAVVGLPPNLFYSTSIPACLLIFKATKAEERRNHVLFVDGSARFVKGKNQNLMTEADMEAVLEAYRIGEDPDGDGGVNVRLVSLDEIKANGFDLNIGRYVRGAPEEAVSLEVALTAYADARAARLGAEQNMFERLSAAGIEVPGV
ncbi:MAG: class I SAM-dependent DNA methyltransferase [Nocardioides sp.]